EIGRDGKPSECLAEDARSFLEGLIPEGKEVKLEFDKERLDKYGRTLAGVFVGDELVNAAIAREGLGVAVDIAPNHRFYAEVYAAEQEASREERGISTLEPDCFVAAEDAAALNEAQSAVSDAEQFAASRNRLDLDSDLAEARRLVARLALAQTGLKTLERAGERQSSFQRDAFGDSYERPVADLEKKLNRAHADLERAVAEEEGRREAARKEEERIEAERKAEQERLAAPSPAPAPQVSQTNSGTSASDSGASGNRGAGANGGGGKYTGCRAYGGNYALNSVDDKGRPYAKIDCATKVQIG
ncbi:thermonuclease family protein, partial [Corynebacterium sp.]|uniref:thermonuclease family protein n=1 Tax=Corynebacterium sp. TaxID=1720 RepID=UPI002A90BAA5